MTDINPASTNAPNEIPSQSPAIAEASQESPKKSMALEPVEFYGLLKLVVSDPSMSPDQKRRLVDELRKSTPASDRWTFRWAIWILGFVVIISVILIGFLSYEGKYIPDGLVAIGSSAAGGLAGLLTPGRREQ